MSVEIIPRSSVIAFHNGTMSPIATIAGSAEYQDLMQRFQTDSNSSRLDRPWTVCRPAPDSSQVSAHDGSFLSFLSATSTWVLDWWRQQPTVPMLPLFPDLDTLILYDSFEALMHANEASSEIESLKLGLAVPEWLTDTQACTVLSAVDLMERPCRI